MSVEPTSASGRSFLPLLELSWDDLLFPAVLPLLSVEDVFRLRAVSRGHHALVTEYFARAKRLDISAKRNISVDAIRVRQSIAEFYISFHSTEGCGYSDNVGKWKECHYNLQIFIIWETILYGRFIIWETMSGMAKSGHSIRESSCRKNVAIQGFIVLRHFSCN